MSSGISQANMAQLLYFLDIFNCKSLTDRLFKKTKLIIGANLKQIAIESMEKDI